MSRYTPHYEITPELQSRAMVAWTKQPPSPAQKRKRIVLGVLGYVALVTVTLALLQFEAVDGVVLIAAGLGFCAGLVVWWFTYRASAQHIMAYANEALDRHGPVHAEFSADEVRIATSISSSTMGWRCFDAVIALPDATVLRAGAWVYAVPDAALGSDSTPEQFRAALTRWIEAAR